MLNILSKIDFSSTETRLYIILGIVLLLLALILVLNKSIKNRKQIESEKKEFTDEEYSKCCNGMYASDKDKLSKTEGQVASIEKLNEKDNIKKPIKEIIKDEPKENKKDNLSSNTENFSNAVKKEEKSNPIEKTKRASFVKVENSVKIKNNEKLINDAKADTKLDVKAGKKVDAKPEVKVSDEKPKKSEKFEKTKKVDQVSDDGVYHKPIIDDFVMDEDDDSDENKPKVVGKFKVEKVSGFYQFSLYANNGQLLYESREYATLATCKNGVETFKRNVAVAKYRVAVDKNGGYKYIFRNRNVIYIGESYSTARAAENSAKSVVRFAAVSEIVD